MSEHEYALGEGSERTLRAIFDGIVRGEGFGNARYARTIFEHALNAQALRLAHESGVPLEELDREDLTELTADDVLAAARTLGEGGDAERPRASRWLWRRAS